jgi:hypothetical protein
MIMESDGWNFYVIFNSIISNKMTKTDPNAGKPTKAGKSIKTESKMQKDKKKPKK